MKSNNISKYIYNIKVICLLVLIFLSGCSSSSTQRISNDFVDEVLDVRKCLTKDTIMNYAAVDVDWIRLCMEGQIKYEMKVRNINDFSSIEKFFTDSGGRCERFSIEDGRFIFTKFHSGIACALVYKQKHDVLASYFSKSFEAGEPYIFQIYVLCDEIDRCRSRYLWSPTILRIDSIFK